MIRVSVLYPNRDGATFNIDYYCNSHMALVKRLLGAGVKGVSVDLGMEGPAGPPPFLAIGHLLFDSVEAFGAALADHGAALMADVPNYTTAQPVIQVSEVKM
jgi:uncharacterized protein (TIGR02118 family)